VKIEFIDLFAHFCRTCGSEKSDKFSVLGRNLLYYLVRNSFPFENDYICVCSDLCESGCVEQRASQDYEDQFSYECEMVHIRQVNTVLDIPNKLTATRWVKGHYL